MIVAYKDGVKHELNLPEIKKRELSLQTTAPDDLTKLNMVMGTLLYPVLITASKTKLTEDERKAIYSGEKKYLIMKEDHILGIIE